MGPTSAKFDPEMEDKDGQNPIQTAEIFTAADARDRAETNAINPPECSRRSAEGAYPADARTLWFDHRGARDQSQRGVRLGENEGNRMRNKIRKNTTSHLRDAPYAHDLETAVSQPGAELPCA